MIAEMEIGEGMAPSPSDIRSWNKGGNHPFPGSYFKSTIFSRSMRSALWRT